ncbi:hypothetical protein LUZ60_003965 [Juncus effusus]|nr:hypothetical protein LUZ60_003965 [Juncus effusus]
MAERKNPAPNLDYWTGFFHGANGTIFDVIENAISVAAASFPQELRSRRDRIAEKLYTFEMARCFGCLERCNNQQLEEAGSVKHDRRTGEEKKLEGPEDIERMVISKGSNSSFDEVEALTDEIERESEILGEVIRIKEILVNNQDQSENSLFESLRRLQLMDLSVDTLQATEIGKAVNGIRKHNSKKIRQLARILIEGWKSLVDEWAASATLTEKMNEGTNVSNSQEEETEDQEIQIEEQEDQEDQEEEEEEGLPSPPLDEGAFLTTQTSNIQLSEFFDGMDDDGNLRNDAQFEKREAERKQPQLKNNNIPVRRQQQEQNPVIKQNRPPISNQSQMRPPQVNSLTKQRKPVNNYEPGLSKPTRPVIQRRPPAGAQIDRLKNFEDDKLEAAKKRLHEGYQQAENAKKQRTIQVLDDIPKPKVAHQNRNNVNLKAKNNIRSWAARH